MADHLAFPLQICPRAWKWSLEILLVEPNVNDSFIVNTTAILVTSHNISLSAVSKPETPSCLTQSTQTSHPNTQSSSRPIASIFVLSHPKT